MSSKGSSVDHVPPIQTTYTSMESTLPTISDEDLDVIQSYWSACNFLTVGQIYLKENPLLKEKLSLNHIKPRLLGHWGTSPGLSLIYAHVSRFITLQQNTAEQSANSSDKAGEWPFSLDPASFASSSLRLEPSEFIFLTGPGHGGPALVANTYLEGTYTEIYPKVTQNEAGLRLLFRQFSTPGGIPSHVSPNVPGSIHEGGELGYVLSHAFGAVFDSPNLIAIAVVGDGECETGPLEGSWKGISFLHPSRDGAVLPVLHLNGYKISGPTVLGRETNENLIKRFESYGYEPIIIESHDEDFSRMHQDFSRALLYSIRKIREIQRNARTVRSGNSQNNLPIPIISFPRPHWPMVVMKTPKGWTGPKQLKNTPIEDTFRAHQVPLSNPKDPLQLAMLEDWLRSYNPSKLFDLNTGRIKSEILRFVPKGIARMSAHPAANGGKVSNPLVLPDFKQYAYDVDPAHPATIVAPSTQKLGSFIKDIYLQNPTNFRLFCPDEANSNKLGDVFDLNSRCFIGQLRVPSDSAENEGQQATSDPAALAHSYNTHLSVPIVDDHVSSLGRVMEVLSEHLCEGWLEGYNLTGRHGIFASYEAFMLIVASMTTQHAKWLEVCSCDPELQWREPIPSLNLLLTSTCWRNDHNGFSHQGPGFMDTLISKRGKIIRIYTPPDAQCLLVVADHCFRSKNYINLIIIDKQPQLQYLTIEQAIQHCKVGASIFKFASNDHILNAPPAIVFGCAGDISTQESLAAVDYLRCNVPKLPVRIVNVADLMCLRIPESHPHGLSQDKFIELFTEDVDVVFAYHGYPGSLHLLIHNRPRSHRFHVRGYIENGTTTTPFDMVVLNETSRFHLVALAMKWIKPKDRDYFPPGITPESIISECKTLIQQNLEYSHTHFEDMPLIKNWKFEG